MGPGSPARPALPRGMYGVRTGVFRSRRSGLSSGLNSLCNRGGAERVLSALTRLLEYAYSFGAHSRGVIKTSKPLDTRSHRASLPPPAPQARKAWSGWCLTLARLAAARAECNPSTCASSRGGAAPPGRHRGGHSKRGPARLRLLRRRHDRRLLVLLLLRVGHGVLLARRTSYWRFPISFARRASDRHEEKA